MKKKQEIIDMMQSEQPLLLLFYTTDCTKHKAIKATIQSIQKARVEEGILLENIDIKKQPRLADELEIEGLPAIVLFQKGDEKWRRAGQITEELILRGLTCLEREN